MAVKVVHLVEGQYGKFRLLGGSEELIECGAVIVADEDQQPTVHPCNGQLRDGSRCGWPVFIRDSRIWNADGTPHTCDEPEGRQDDEC